MRKFFVVFILIAAFINQGNPAIAVAPATPSNISIKAGTTQAYGAATLEISWGAVTGAVAYGVRLKRQDNGTTAASETVDGQQNTTISFTALSGGVTYIIQVNAVNAGSELSAWSSEALTAVPKTAPQAPSKPTVVPAVRKATVSWVAIPVANNGGFAITSYIVTEINSAKTVTALASATSIELTGLSNGADVEFTVAAVNDASAAGTVSEKSDKYKLGNIPSTMSAPTLAATTTNTEARVSWQNPASDGGSSLLSFSIKLIKNGVDLVTQVIEQITDTAYTFTSLLAGTYEAKIQATNAVGDSVLSPISGQLTLGASASASATPTAAPTATSTATPSASAPPPPPTPTPSVTASASSSSAPISGGGFFGGGGGGGFVPPAVAALGTPSPSPSITPSLTPAPVPSASQLPIATKAPVATPSPIPSRSTTPSVVSRPGIATNARGEVTKTTTFAIPTRVTGPVKATTISGSKVSISASLKTAVQPAIPAVKKGSVIKVVVKGADGKSYTIASTTAKSTGTYKAPAIKFSKPGTYQVTVMVGKVKKVITYKISK